MEPKKYKEYKVQVDWSDKKNPKPIDKILTARGHVSIHEHEAELNNEKFTRTHLWYELDAEEKSETRKQADELGIKYRDNISDVKLQEKIDNYLNE